jgi:hypothetical protein
MYCLLLCRVPSYSATVRRHDPPHDPSPWQILACRLLATLLFALPVPLPLPLYRMSNIVSSVPAAGGPRWAISEDESLWAIERVSCLSGFRGLCTLRPRSVVVHRKAFIWAWIGPNYNWANIAGRAQPHLM